ncbi:MAG: VIT domain-containing protein [Planctomycetota bacterium]
MPARTFAGLLPLFAFLATTTPAAFGQGVLVNEREDLQARLPRVWTRPAPRPAPSTYKIESIDVNATVKDQVAKVQVSQKFRNTGSQQMEVAFLFPLPDGAAIDQLTLMVDGKELAGELLPADEARKRYEAIVRQNQDPALLEWVGRGMFRTSVFPVPAGADRTVTLRYNHLLRASGSLVDFSFPLATAKYTSAPVEKLSVRVAIESPRPITNLYSPSYQLKIDRPSPTSAVVKHTAEGVLPSADFRLFFDSPRGDAGSDSGDGGIGASVVSFRPDKTEPGYFLLLANPTIEAKETEPLAKTVLVVVDRSGSMSGEKLDQAKGAVRQVLGGLREGDTFNIIAYDSQVESFRPELQPADKASIDAAGAFVDGLYAGGSTNIDGALGRALGMLQDSSRPNYVLFLTDGLPTTGEKREARIVENTKGTNNVRARVFAFGVGYDVNSRLLDKLARVNFGQSEYVRPNEDIEAAVGRLANRLDSPVLTGVTLTVDVEGASLGSSAVSGVYPRGEFDLFADDQTVLVGRYSRPGDAKVTLTGAVSGEEVSYNFPAKLTEESLDDTNAFVGRLWAMRRVGEIIDIVDLEGKNDELIKELVDLATTHGIVTQYTSFLADETADHNAIADNRRRARVLTDGLAATSGRFGFQQRGAKLRLQRAATATPRFAAPSQGFGGRQPEAELAEAPIAVRRESLGLRAAGNAWYYDAKADRSRIAGNIRQIGRKTFFQRTEGKVLVWCDSSVNAEEQKNAKPIERYSREYFDLVAKHGGHVAQYLAVDEPVVVKLDGVVYRW